ncbi:hypothetical protein LCGC14_0635400 [marine sediment metagenome]|uniref:Uncharacterized protein n=1 Tax=marine sediment metagenome TaxID=412755 RepID=A0A0F9R0K5_9ZZZZ|nr:MAG: hypothetical protein Lokiarch_17380 [Candidatus Lokiarchaeum sp. GC14_75]
MEIVDSVYDLYQQNYEKTKEKSYDISDLVIPFGKIFKKTKQVDIYSGNENIPFKERETEFKMILRQEFSEF